MSQSVGSYVNVRVLKLNVGYLLNAGPSNSRDSVIDLPRVKVSEDLKIEYLQGDIRLSRAKEGVLVQADLETAVNTECYRCLDPVTHVIHIDLEELYTTQPQRETEFRILEDGILDLAPLLRAEVLIEGDHRILCNADCQGLCPVCGVNRNHTQCDCETDTIDPRLAALKQLLD